jgi:hypothetical protein
MTQARYDAEMRRVCRWADREFQIGLGVATRRRVGSVPWRCRYVIVRRTEAGRLYFNTLGPFPTLAPRERSRRNIIS